MASRRITAGRAHTLDPNDDSPDVVVQLARADEARTVERGVAVCGSGVDASVCINETPTTNGSASGR